MIQKEKRRKKEKGERRKEKGERRKEKIMCRGLRPKRTGRDAVCRSLWDAP
jgi:hypothetical protein